MTTLASLRILLGLDSGGVKSGAANVKGDLKAVQAEANKTNATLQNIGKGAQTGLGLGAGLGVGLIAFQATSRAVGALTGFLNDSVNAAIEEEAGIKRLGQALTANIPAFDGNTAAIEANIASQEALGFSDGDLRDSLAKLSGATHDVGKSFEIQALAMDLARFKNIDLASATDELIKVQAGSFRSLKSLGIELKAGASATEAFGLIQKVVAGQAAAFGETTAGATAAAGIAVQNLQEDIGIGLAPIVQDLAVGIRRDVIPALRGMGDALGAVGTVAGPVIELLKIMGHNSDDLAAHVKEQARADAIAAIGAQAATAAYAAYGEAQGALQQSFREGKISQQQYEEQSKALSDTFARLSANTNGFADSAQDLRPHVNAVAGALNQADDNAAGLIVTSTRAKEATSDLSAAQIAVAQATIDASHAHADLSEAQKAAGDAAVGDMGAVIDLARAQVADKMATDKLKAAQDDLVAVVKEVPPAMLGAGHGTDTFSDALLRVKNDALIAALGIDTASDAAKRAWEVFRHTPNKTGDIGGVGSGFETGGDQGALDTKTETQLQNTRDWLARQQSLLDEAAANAKRNAADIAAAYHDKLGKAFSDTADRAHEAFARIHEDNLKAIEDVRNTANAQLDEQERAIRGTVDAARAQVQAMRDARHLGELRGAVTGASTPEELAAANRALNDFLTDQRLAALGSQADTQIAALHLQKQANDDKAALAVIVENQRNKDQVKALEQDLANLKEHLGKYTKEWEKAFAEIARAAKRYGVADIVGVHPISLATGSKATSAIPSSISPAVAGAGAIQPVINVVVHNYLDGEELPGHVNKRMAVSYSRVSSGGIAPVGG